MFSFIKEFKWTLLVILLISVFISILNNIYYDEFTTFKVVFMTIMLFIFFSIFYFTSISDIKESSYKEKFYRLLFMGAWRLIVIWIVAFFIEKWDDIPTYILLVWGFLLNLLNVLLTFIFSIKFLLVSIVILLIIIIFKLNNK